jgi:hypothetical protein
MIFFELSSFVLGLLLFGFLLGTTLLGALLGRRARQRSGHLKEPFGILQGALLGIVGLLLAFGLSLAVSRYENRRENVVTTANAIGTTYLRAQTLTEPERTRSLGLLVGFTEAAVGLSDHTPGGGAAKAAVAREDLLQRRLWAQASAAVERSPQGTAPRLYIESLNDMFDDETARVATLSNRVPTAVLLLEILGAAFTLALLAAYLAIAGRGGLTVIVASALIAFLLLVTADLDRPTRGLIQVPDTVLRDQLESMKLPPAAAAPRLPTR